MKMPKTRLQTTEESAREHKTHGLDEPPPYDVCLAEAQDKTGEGVGVSSNFSVKMGMIIVSTS